MSEEEKSKKKLYLNHAESAQLSANNAKHQLLKQEQKILDLRKLLIDSQENTLKRDRIILNNDIRDLKQTDQNFKDENQEFLNGITYKYDQLEDGKWGYNPQTGEVVINE